MIWKRRAVFLAATFLTGVLATRSFDGSVSLSASPTAGWDVLVDSEQTRSFFSVSLEDVVESLLRGTREDLEPIKIEYPLDGSLFPPEVVPSPFFWRDSHPGINLWLIEIRSPGGERPVHIVTQGIRPPPVIDMECLREDNGYEENPVLIGTHYWKPDSDLWEMIKSRSVDHPVTLLLYGFDRKDLDRLLSRGQVSLRTSRDLVGAPIFYRDVPLMPSTTKDGTIKPLPPDAIPLVKLRLRDISDSESRVLLENPWTCVNCHSFSRDGRVLGMDMDGPDGDKGAYGLAPIEKEVRLTPDRIISWNSFPDKPRGKKTFGLFSRVSPDGRYVVSMVNESVFVANYRDFRFLQSFFPTRGILAIYSRETGRMSALPGADDPNYVHTNATWSPDGRFLVFSRAPARNAYAASDRPLKANDSSETRIQYDLYRIPFNHGRGGQAVPVPGASQNGKSNSFAKYSPDEKWIVFVQAENGQLLRPDSELYIIPAEGGRARRLSGNTPLMNSWHSWSPAGRWLVFSSKWLTPFTQMFLTHIDEEGHSSPPILIPNATAANRAVNIPEFVNIESGGLARIEMPAMNYVLHARYGIENAREGRYPEAIREYRQALELEPRYAMVHYNLGTLHLELDELEPARHHLERAVELEKDHALAYNNLGTVWFRLGDYDRAEQSFAEALHVAPHFAEAHQNLGELNQRRGRLDEAEASLRMAVRYYEELKLGDNSKLASAVNSLGNLLVQQGRLNEAETWYSKVILLTPEHPIAYYNLAQVYSRQGELDQALSLYGEAVERDPDFAVAHFELAGLLQETDRCQEAVRHYARVAELKQDKFGQALNELAWLMATCSDDAVRDGEQALRLAEQLCRATDYRRPALLDTLAAAFAELGRFAEAIEKAQMALRLAEANGERQLSSELRRRLETYRQKKAWRDSH